MTKLQSAQGKRYVNVNIKLKKTGGKINAIKKLNKQKYVRNKNG